MQTTANGNTARQLLMETHFDVSLMDIKLPDATVWRCSKKSKKRHRYSDDLMTAQNTMRNAIGAMKNGAFDYITKPFDLDEVLVLVKRAIDSRKLSRDFRELKEEVKKRFEPGVNIIGTSSSMQKVYKTIGQVVDTQATILILGRAARVKSWSPRRFITIRRAGISRLSRSIAPPFRATCWKASCSDMKGALYRRFGSAHRQIRIGRRRNAFSSTKWATSRWNSKPNSSECSRIGNIAGSAARAC